MPPWAKHLNIRGQGHLSTSAKTLAVSSLTLPVPAGDEGQDSRLSSTAGKHMEQEEHGGQGGDMSSAWGLGRLPGSWDPKQRMRVCSGRGEGSEQRENNSLGVRVEHRIFWCQWCFKTSGFIECQRWPQTTHQNGIPGAGRRPADGRNVSLNQGNSLNSPSRKSPFQPVESGSFHWKPISPGFSENSQPLPARRESHI